MDYIAQNKPEPLIFRQVALPLSTFDYLKDFQRGHLQRTGVHLSNNQCLTLILAEHKEAAARGLR